ncbi:MAG: class I SAM-dependent methyltransferase [Acidobacteria bacterium]|nr:class I SAM-dependent methyltransferase [Acidobacteriota bacterium]
MVISDDLHLCYPSAYTPYRYDPETPEVNLEPDSVSIGNANWRSWMRNTIAVEIKGGSQSGLRRFVGRVLSHFRFIRERTYFGIVPDECIPRGESGRFALDVGCGAGWMLKRLKMVGWIAEGVEWDPNAAELASTRTGLNVFVGDFRSIDLPEAHYDLIYLSHVFEHFDNPNEVLVRLHGLLRNRGILVLIFPNPVSIDSRWYGKDWFAWEVPRHLILPSPYAIRRLAESSGFRIKRVSSNCARHLWVSSKSYQLGLNPESSKPELSLAEKLGLKLQTILTFFGKKVGSEQVVVLEKVV